MGRGKSYCKPQKLAISHLLAVSPVPAHRPCRLRLADARQPRSRLCVRCDTLCRLDTRRLDGARAAARCTVTSNGRASDAAAVTPLARALMRRARGRRQRRRRRFAVSAQSPRLPSCGTSSSDSGNRLPPSLSPYPITTRTEKGHPLASPKPYKNNTVNAFSRLPLWPYKNDPARSEPSAIAGQIA